MKKAYLYFQNILYLIKPVWKYGKNYIFVSLFLSIFIAPLSPITYVFLTQTVVDSLASERSFFYVASIICLLYGANMGVWLIRKSVRELFLDIKKIEISSKINADTYYQGLATDYKYFDNPDYYDSYTWAAKEYSKKSLSLIDTICRLATAFTTVAALVAIIVSASPIIIVIAVLQLVLTTLIEINRNKLNINRKEDILKHDRRIGYVHRTMYSHDNIQDIKTTKIKDYLMSMLNHNVEQKIKIYKKYNPKMFFNSCLNISTAFITEASIMIYISFGILVSKSISGAGMFLGMFYAAQNLVGNLQDFFNTVVDINEYNLYAKKIKLFFDLPSEIEYNTKIEIPNIKYQINGKPFSVTFKNVSFSYPNSSFCLKNLNIQVAPGEKIAIVGENGAGKSTMAKLLLRLYDVDSGEILYNDVSIKEYDIYNLRHYIGISFQTPQVYALPFTDNIKVYRNLDLDSLNKTICEAGLDNILKKNNVDATAEVTREFDDSGIMMSGGEKQKLSIARIMASAYTDPFGLILLDEPSSALDPIAEYELEKLLLSETNKATTIIISHRLSMVKNVDRIYLLSNGEIVEMGSHSQLISQKGLYYEMFSKQAEKYIET